MELNWSTFILEIINFLILIWILKHFFYKPVLDVIARRRAGIEKNMEDAQSLHSEAKALQKQYENRLAEWDHERQAAREALDKEIQVERERQMSVLQATLEEERGKNRFVAQRQLEASRLHSEKEALMQGAQFATKLLSAVSGPELEKRLIDLFLDELSSLPTEQLSKLQDTAGKSSNNILVTSAHPLDSNNRQSLERILHETIAVSGPVLYEQDKALLAGIRISIGAWILRANLLDELKGFTDFAHEI
ncbi:MAG: F0F1 ATP synthase subunit delta [gamma proteobacterium endosymbiont of Lamellibrachia anaximandri]|nr:F0F1 ATP synthase subunit delta [gamma proteobacterium endosymbiont of Lamellibrachia anaximandri]MBL3535194.1 F0F1 ATP synthase subunit delta [gamma proteobacterium endosymbiont of Lamellibrachia anaximandri]